MRSSAASDVYKRHAIDGDGQNTYQIEVNATDGLNTATQTVVITVNDVDEILPVFTSATTRLYKENGTNVVYIASANDANAVTLSLGKSNDEALFSINEGEITFKTTPDFEAPIDGDQNNSYIIELLANDGLNTANQLVTITVTDVDEILPVFSSATIANFAENSTEIAYTPLATDANPVTYTLGTENDEKRFVLKTGVVTFIDAPNFEKPVDADFNNTYIIEIQASDGLNTATQIVTILVTDVDEVLPVFSSPLAVSNTENGSGSAYTIIATDANTV
ncbi:hypothetical protein, partial [Roseivirga sp.]|uniref:hypothetical protein n=1 Tax=Roseivirga sp. TaxID=1964215 RepID=UPI003B8BA618